jgi:predicted ATPase
MRLDSLKIEEFKNLRNLYIDFDETSPYTVLIGQNGSGKSNLIEAIANIFRNLDLDEPAPFTYELRYHCRGNLILVDAKKAQYPTFKVRQGGQKEFAELPRTHFMKADDHDRPLYRPAFVFGYYSGPTDRLRHVFEKHTERFYDLIINEKKLKRAKEKQLSSNALRRLFYTETLHGQFALLAFFMDRAPGADSDRAFLREHLQIDGLDSVLFALRRPPWPSRKGDPRFWNAQGEVRDFLSHLFPSASVPMRMPRRIPVGLKKNPSIDSLYLFLPEPVILEDVYATHYGNQYAFFTALESTHISKLLAEVRTRVRLKSAEGVRAITYRDLSEGEQQLLLVLGLLKFTEEEETLFLLDEPDTHLNPAWSVQYLEFLDRFVANRESCHIIMATHDPLVFAGLHREQVRIMRRGESGWAEAIVPDDHPKGMGVQAILTSDLFGLRSTLDHETQQDVDAQRRLSQKEGPLTPDEESELAHLNERLRPLGFSKTTRDPLYQLFVKAWTDRENLEWTAGTTLTPEQRSDRTKLAADIVAEIVKERRK